MGINWINKQRPLEEEKDRLRRAIENERIARQALGVPFGEHVVQTDDRSITNIMATQSAIQAGIAPPSISWRMASDQMVSLSHAEFTQMSALVFGYCEACYQAAFAHKDAVSTLSDHATVEAYWSLIQGGWP